MKIKAWGTRGSIAISNAESIMTGGNTTCFEVQSQCLPKGVHLMLDAGTGLVPAGMKYLSEIGNGLQYVIMFTHYHYDHILGLTLAPPTFIEAIPMTFYGPIDEGVGPKEMINDIFKRPYFPVDARRIKHRMEFKPLQDFDVSVIVVHPEGGFATFKRHRYMTLLEKKNQLPINGKTYPIAECLVISMVHANHGNSTCISYRFEEMPTGKTFVLCTDHEDTVGVPTEFGKHLSGVDLLIIDGQYQQEKYLKQTAGFGHGTGHGVVKQALITGVKSVGITHHDPNSTDAYLINVILKEAISARANIEKEMKPEDIHLKEDGVFLVSDYQEIEV